MKIITGYSETGRVGSGNATWFSRITGLKDILWSFLVIPLVGDLNLLLDIHSYGMILFPPSQAYFDKYRTAGASMYSISCLISQVIFSLLSTFESGVVGSMLVESIPYFHSISECLSVELSGEELISTTLAGYFILSLSISISFFVLYYFELTSFLRRLPRQIIYGSMCGVASFLAWTGLILVNLQHRKDTYWASVQIYFTPPYLYIWTVSAACSLLFFLWRRYSTRFHSMSAFCIAHAVVFHLGVALLRIDSKTLVENQLMLDRFEASPFEYFHFLRANSPLCVQWSLLYKIIPSIFGAVVIGIINFSINGPSFALQTKQQCNLGKEAQLHALSSLATTVVACMPSYFVYSTSTMLFHSGGTTRKASYALAIHTVILVLFSSFFIGFIPKTLIISLLFSISLDIFAEVVVQVKKNYRPMEIATIVIIGLTMSLIGFSEGIFVGCLLTLASHVLNISYCNNPHYLLGAGTNLRSTERKLNVFHQAIWNKSSAMCQVFSYSQYLYFWNGSKVVEDIEGFFRSGDSRVVVLDFTGVTLIDCTAISIISEAIEPFSSRIILTNFPYYDYSGGSFGSLEEAVFCLWNIIFKQLDSEDMVFRSVPDGNLGYLEISDVVWAEAGRIVTDASARLRYVVSRREEFINTFKGCILEVCPGGAVADHNGLTDNFIVVSSGCITVLAPNGRRVLFHEGTVFGFPLPNCPTKHLHMAFNLGTELSSVFIIPRQLFIDFLSQSQLMTSIEVFL